MLLICFLGITFQLSGAGDITELPMNHDTFLTTEP